MGALLFAMGAPTLLFGILALLAMRFGAESRPYFDERPVADDRPNWFPIARTLSSDDGEDDDDAGPPDGEPVPGEASEPPAPRARRPATAAAPSAGAA